MEMGNEDEYGNDSDPDVTPADIQPPSMVHVKHESHVGALATSAQLTAANSPTNVNIINSSSTPSPTHHHHHHHNTRLSLHNAEQHHHHHQQQQQEQRALVVEKKVRIRARAKNWTEEEKTTLLDLILEQMPHRSTQVWTWDAVAQELQKRSNSTHLRTVEQCKQQLRDLKKGYQAALTKQEDPTVPVRYKFRDALEAIYRKEKDNMSFGGDFRDIDVTLASAPGKIRKRASRMRVLPAPNKRRRKSAPPGLFNPALNPGHLNVGLPMNRSFEVVGVSDCGTSAAAAASAAASAVASAVASAANVQNPGISLQNVGAGGNGVGRIDGAGQPRGGSTLDQHGSIDINAIGSLPNGTQTAGPEFGMNDSTKIHSASESLKRIPPLLDAMNVSIQRQTEVQKALLQVLQDQSSQNAALLNMFATLRKDSGQGA